MRDLHHIAENIHRIQSSIHDHAGGRDVTLMAVTKTRDAEEVCAALEAGARHLGENYLQEALDKQQAVAELTADRDNLPTPCWHFIGPIQSNKTRPIAEHFDWVHSVDREKIARRLSEQRPSGSPALNICLQVNIDREDSKSGALPEDTLALAEAIMPLPHLQLRGLMAIPAAGKAEAEQRASFAALRQLLEQLQARWPEAPLDTLSMGMSGDMSAAIAEGATIVRVGTAIFGPRA
ncbi:YggS family pyridoxal phosphate-dependent enzyme [Spongiibacter nanhainus]|uniref:Pyridoxal phosphate homeostasis protein n=1 Tax=Spongiibacter nanhainus TaxID=2794344 RepID=A0A7T4R0Y7_9GAMM|nr:YggS family pyridoxal phosphate-dependent enzyme [Spongiibacter nanhainus]QQD18421.1 YggS family pyridoxal phosphate-dependent enzyme [Spongiibacter nanhainus]